MIAPASYFHKKLSNYLQYFHFDSSKLQNLSQCISIEFVGHLIQIYGFLGYEVGIKTIETVVKINLLVEMLLETLLLF